MKRILVAGWIGSGNMGDEGILASINESLAGFAKVRALSTDEAHTKRMLGISTAPFDVLPHPVRFLRAFREADLVLIGGGGLLQDRSSLLNVPRYAYKAVLARLLRRPVAFYAISVGPIRHRATELLVRMTLNRCSFVTVRDAASRERLISYGVRADLITVTADPAITLKPSTEPSASWLQMRTSGKTPLVGVSLRHPAESSRLLPVGLAHRLGLARRRAGAEYDALISVVANALDRIHEACGVRFAFLPLWYTRDRQVHDDVLAAMEHRDSAWELDREHSPHDFKALVGSVDLMISMRLHGVIFAASTGTPFIALGYAQKVSDFVDQVGMPKQLISLDALTAETLTSLALATLADRESLSNAMRGALPILASGDEANVAAVRRTLDSTQPAVG